MKQIKISNGEIRIGYEYADLSKEVQDKVLNEQVEFEVEVMDDDSPYKYLADEMEKMQTPWFLGQEIYSKHKEDLIETIKINNYLFDEDGEIINVTYHTEGNEIVKVTYGKKELPCIIENYDPEYPIQDDVWSTRKWNKDRTKYIDLSATEIQG